jgi:hypothetical protein
MVAESFRKQDQFINARFQLHAASTCAAVGLQYSPIACFSEAGIAHRQFRKHKDLLFLYFSRLFSSRSVFFNCSDVVPFGSDIVTMRNVPKHLADPSPAA